jgi:hypothetical protein
MPQQVSWCGTRDELLQLTAVIGHNCACASQSTASTRPTCAAHRMLWQDQRALNGLLFARHIAERLRREEFSAGSAESDSERTVTDRGNMVWSRRGPRCPSMLPGAVLLVLGIASLCVQDAWLVWGATTASRIQPAASDCFAGINATLIVAWAVVGLLLTVCGLSMPGGIFVTNQLSLGNRAAPTSAAAASTATSLRA